jgi:cytoskeleton protein RodZ
MSMLSLTNELLTDSRKPPASPGVFSFCVGQTLRKARENRKLTLDQVSTQLRLTCHVVEAIEESRHLDVAQNQVYLRGFVRSYAKFLDLDPEAIAQKFKEELPPSDAEEELIFPIQTTSKSSPRKWIFLFSVAATVVVSVVSFYLIQDMHQAAIQGETEISLFLSNPRTLLGTAQVESRISGTLLTRFLKTGEVALAHSLGFSVSRSVRSAIPQERAEEKKPTSTDPLILEAREESWVEVKDATSQKIYVQRLLRPGDSYQVPQNKKNLVLSTGNMGGLRIRQGRAVLESVGNAGEVRRGIPLIFETLKKADPSP